MSMHCKTIVCSKTLFARHLTFVADNFTNMIARTKKTFVWLWVAALLSATMGVSVQQVYCYCLNKTTVSLFDADDACHAAAQAVAVTDCCVKKPAKASHSCCENLAAEQKGCTQKTTTVFQLKTEFESNFFALKKLELPKSWASSPLPPSYFAPEVLAQKFVAQTFERPPPPASGRMICVRHGVFRC